MKAKVKYQEVDFIQYDGTNKEEVEKFIGKPCIDHVTYLTTIINGNFIVINKDFLVIKDNNNNIFTIGKGWFFTFYEPVND